MRLKELRIKNGYTQTELAKKLQYKQNTISQWESGKNSMDAETILEVAEFFGVSTDYLLGRPAPVTAVNADPLQGRLVSTFNELNDIGKREAIKRVSELSLIPHYCKVKKEMPIAAHNDAVIDKKELELMREDLDEL